jgi:serine/threonine protein kinase
MPESKPYQIGDVIGQKYEVAGVVGRGGFGIVYLVYSRETESVYALKTFRDEYLEDPEVRALFRKEAQIWVDLERHPYLVRAYFVDEISGRLYIAMEYIAPDEGFPNTLQGYLDRRPPDLAQSLRWAIQFCHGMEYAYSKGVRCHRDIKPGNIMISQDKTVKITDFGLAGVLGASEADPGIRLNIQEGKVGLSFRTLAGKGRGTPTHMPPEQFYDAAYCDQRSDIYAFGVVLFQMASGGKLPFLPALPKDNSQVEHMRFWQEIQRLHEQAPVPEMATPLFTIIQRCLEKIPEKRYSSFSELRTNLEVLLKQKTGEVIRVPEREVGSLGVGRQGFKPR